MLASLLLPAVADLRLTDVKLQDERFTFRAAMTNATACCPTCQVSSTRVHSRYHRHVADLPWAGYPVALVIQVRRFRCQSTDCVQRIFCERLSPAIATYARQTERLQEQWRTLALAMGGELTARVLPHLGMQSSPATLLVRLRALPPPEQKPVRVLGIDDWAMRRGHVYGTILIDLEQGAVVDLLADRTTATVAAWLADHPEVEIISRDRFVNYVEAARQGAPGAIQVADRFHLLKNLHDALQRMLDRFAQTLRQATELAAAPPVQPSASADVKEPPAVPEQAPPATQPDAVPPVVSLTFGWST